MDDSHRRVLVIGIGNALRGDDGVGPWLARRVGGRCVHQLTPELALALQGLDHVLFVDACRTSQRPRLRPLTPGSSPAVSLGSHGLAPAGLLAMGRLLHGRAPEAQLLLVPARVFGHGATLSPAVRQQLPAAEALLRQWLAAHA